MAAELHLPLSEPPGEEDESAGKTDYVALKKEI